MLPGVAVDLREIRAHRLHHPRIDAGRGVIVEIDGKLKHYLGANKRPHANLRPGFETLHVGEDLLDGAETALDDLAFPRMHGRTFDVEDVDDAQVDAADLRLRRR